MTRLDDRAQPYIFQTRVRWADQDAQGHVNNVTFIDYLQEARVDWILNGPMAHMLEQGVLVTSHRIDYLATAHFIDEPIIIKMWATRIGGARFTIAYDLSQGDRAIGRAVTECVTYDVASRSLRRLRPEERDWLETWTGPALEFRDIPHVEWVSGIGYEYPLRVRWSEVDMYGHVNNVAFLTYLQEAHIAALDDVRRADGWGTPEGDSSWLVASQDITYLAQMPYQIEPYLMEIVILRIGSSSMTMEIRIRDPHVDQVFAEGHIVLVYANRAGTPKAIPEGMREQLRPITLT